MLTYAPLRGNKLSVSPAALASPITPSIFLARSEARLRRPWALLVEIEYNILFYINLKKYIYKLGMARCFQQRGLSEDFLEKKIKIKNIISTRLELVQEMTKYIKAEKMREHRSKPTQPDSAPRRGGSFDNGT